MTRRMNHVLCHVIRCKVSFPVDNDEVNNSVVVTKIDNTVYNGERSLNEWRGKQSVDISIVWLDTDPIEAI
ncbi:hypothetical protein V6N12_020482 [Hibiscus sabdariffa]|uniref:Uncharacterized protein n=1 Tax=Hibiscus sabdariffa TaxID=183260 RepID=A0ABR2CY91_9ROSI